MACGKCNRSLSAAEESVGQAFIACLQTVLGTDPTGKWKDADHAALYRRVSTLTAYQTRRGMTATELAAIPFGTEPNKSALIAVSFPLYDPSWPASFWTCLGHMTAETAKAMQEGRQGLYWDMILSAGSLIQRAESARFLQRPVPSKAAAAAGFVATVSGLLWWGGRKR